MSNRVDAQMAYHREIDNSPEHNAACDETVKPFDKDMLGMIRRYERLRKDAKRFLLYYQFSDPKLPSAMAKLQKSLERISGSAHARDKGEQGWRYSHDDMARL